MHQIITFIGLVTKQIIYDNYSRVGQLFDNRDYLIFFIDDNHNYGHDICNCDYRNTQLS